jgi:hypothetical protein
MIRSPLRRIELSTRSLALVMAFCCPCRLLGATMITNSDAVQLAAAVQEGGTITLAFDGVVKLTEPLIVATNTTLDARGHSVALDGNNLVRHFVVTNNSTLGLINLTLMNGRDADNNGPVDQDGRPGWGGAIYCSGGNLELIDCQFTDNHVLGGSATVSNQATNTIHYGGGGYGGAIYCENGGLWATNSLVGNNSSTGGQGARWDTRYSAPGADAFGGAIFCTNSICTLLGVRLTNNLVQAGALNGYWSLDGSGQAFGGTVGERASTTLLSRCVLDANRAAGAPKSAVDPADTGAAKGGSVYQDGGSMAIEQTLFTRNSAMGGPGYAKNADLTYLCAPGEGAPFSNSQAAWKSGAARSSPIKPEAARPADKCPYTPPLVMAWAVASIASAASR